MDPDIIGVDYDPPGANDTHIGDKNQYGNTNSENYGYDDSALNNNNTVMEDVEEAKTYESDHSNESIND